MTKAAEGLKEGRGKGKEEVEGKEGLFIGERAVEGSNGKEGKDGNDFSLTSLPKIEDTSDLILDSKTIKLKENKHYLLVRLQRYRLKWGIDLRHWYLNKTTNEIAPSMKGINLPFDIWPQVIKIIEEQLKLSTKVTHEKSVDID